MIKTETEFTEQLNSANLTSDADDLTDKPATNITPMSQEEAREYTEQIRRDLEGIKSTPQRLLNVEQRQGFIAEWHEDKGVTRTIANFRLMEEKSLQVL